ncbi:hypothetical protein BD408DRAFT_437665, partial [Parasitella parasitica]
TNNHENDWSSEDIELGNSYTSSVDKDKHVNVASSDNWISEDVENTEHLNAGSSNWDSEDKDHINAPSYWTQEVELLQNDHTNNLNTHSNKWQGQSPNESLHRNEWIGF